MPMQIPDRDGDLFRLMKADLYSAVIGDILDQMERYRQFLPPEIRPVLPEMILCGRAMPVLERDLPAPGMKMPGEGPFGKMLDALDDLKPGEIYLCTGASPDYALVGEIMCTRMQVLGAAGTLCDGFHRDTNGILALGFPCFSRGSWSQDQAPRGRVVDYRVPVEIGGVHVEPGDLVFGDRDGTVVIPRALEKEVIERAWLKATGEKTTGDAIRGGMSAREAFARYKIM